MTLGEQTHVDVAIIGGGISGLATAYYLQSRAEREQRPLHYLLVERSNRPGGKVVTDQVHGFGDQPFVVEGGPDSFITQKPWAMQLARELGLEDRILGTNDHLRKTYVLHRGKPTPLPDGVLMIVPTRFMPFALSPLISPLGKLRMGMDLFIPPKRDDKDETLAEFIRRRLGNEALDKIAEPLMSGISNAESERQSLLATFPRFREIEKRHGSLIKGMLASKRSPKPASTGKPVSIFTSLRGGTQELIDTLAAALTGEIRLGTAVTSITALPQQTGYALTFDDGTTRTARHVVLATPAYVSADLLRPLTPGAADLLASIRYVSTGTISFGFRRDEVAHPLNGFGVVIPRSERRPINALTWSSTKFDYRAPEGYALIRVFFGGSRNPQMIDKSDDDLLSIARSELDALMGIRAEPVMHRLYRWYNATPQYDAGHLDRVAAIVAALPAGIHVSGSPYRGIGLPDCVHQAQGTADQIWTQLVTIPQGETVS